ncbi:MAG: DUF2182 domain-containing protein [Pseudohongiellaceae bacterium]
MVSRLIRSWDMLLLWLSLAAIVLLAWTYLIVANLNMPEQAMAGMRGWALYDYVMMFAMWSIMMVGMMVPTSIRAVRIYAMVNAKAGQKHRRIARTYWFILGYLFVWFGFSAAATVLQGLLTEYGLMSAMMVGTSPYLGAAILVAAGLYQLSPWKDTCLRHCQSPAQYLAGGFGPRPTDGIRLGLGHGAYCLGCCWVLMLLLFVGGVMNLIWIAIITGFVLLEKLLPSRVRLTHSSAVLMIASGLVYFIIRA